MMWRPLRHAEPPPMAEPEPPRTPDTRAAGTASWLDVPPLDAPAVAGTAPYPLDHTASFAPAPPEAVTVSFGADATRPNPNPDIPQIPGFQMLSVLGDGGMGTVFKALHLKMNKVVALKLIKSGWARDRDFHVRFAREVKTLARLDHPNVVPIFDASSWSGLPYLTMKFVAGKTLYHHLERLRHDLPAAARLLAKVARAVGYLHTKGIVHRDLKPLNILVDTGDEPLVADFGLVRPTDADDAADLSITLVPLGTRQYMSPEQTMGGRENYTPACDIWALGIILYELFTGRRPFEDDGETDIFHRIRFDDPPPFAQLAPDVPPELEAIVRHCLEKRPENRYARAADVADDLERWLAGQSVAAPPVPAAPAQPPVQLVVAPPRRR
ncbi:MAG: serine/threonine protein kinase, partial [Planctomycetes bacterium]|nr:serine/threonine protein kinase [Planctomycetota bacterium]